jgi:hypothetical protein|tara:strand:+ start:239 stop:403 length:165 start_codon:yes stop_codon:yes gene_type:complete
MPISKHHRKGRPNKVWRKAMNKMKLSLQWFNGKKRVINSKGDLTNHPDNVRRLK